MGFMCGLAHNNVRWGHIPPYPPPPRAPRNATCGAGPRRALQDGIRTRTADGAASSRDSSRPPTVRPRALIGGPQISGSSAFMACPNPISHRRQHRANCFVEVPQNWASWQCSLTAAAVQMHRPSPPCTPLHRPAPPRTAALRADCRGGAVAAQQLPCTHALPGTKAGTTAWPSRFKARRQAVQHAILRQLTVGSGIGR
jgi:hypothetical protein